ncbi:MAG: tRNA glutamyl-Q(34) synthetase GluQRS [Pseudomonadota bacterium]
MPEGATYRGRFAPSPTGPLHFGSLIAAVGSYLDAHRHGGDWLVRIEDIDPPREKSGAAKAILKSLDLHGFEWAGAVLYQSTRSDAYEGALRELAARGATYPRTCSRRDIAKRQPPGARGLRYPGTCREGPQRRRAPAALRVRTNDALISFVDRVQGRISVALESDDGDFVVRRKDGLFAYQLAVVVDDAAQGITDVVRGVDLLDSTPRQLHLQQLLGLKPLRYAHLPIAVDERGQKLSKQTLAAPLDARSPADALVRALAFLGQEPPADLQHADVRGVWAWAQAHWRLDKVSGTQRPAAAFGSAQRLP